MNARLTLLLVMFPFAALAQGFAGLGTTAEGYAIPERGTVLTFPADHGPHPDYRIEWWYLTANLKDSSGRDYGVQWTLFRSALRPGDTSGWTSPQLWMGHAALTTPDHHFVAERLGRGGIGQAGVTAEPFAAWIDNWRMEGSDINDLFLTAGSSEFSFDLHLRAEGPFILHGDRGYSVKSAGGQASYYYSQPAYVVSGTLTTPDGDIAVTGNGWLDREWSSQPLAGDQRGWDWFSLSFDSGDRLMGFQLRDSGDGYSSGTWIGADGEVSPLPPGRFQTRVQESSEVGGHSIPTTWQVRLPERNVDVSVEAINPHSWMATSFPYWEGPVRISGSHTGRGYLEMTGYDQGTPEDGQSDLK